MARYFVTGATGFTGGRVARQLTQAGHSVVAIARDVDRARDLPDLGIEVVNGDVNDRESLREPMRGVEGVFHVAGWYRVGVRDKTPAQRINVDGTRNVLSMMQELQIPRGVYTSTIAVSGDTRGRLVDESCEFGGPG